jgi:hypothetical protein
MSNFRSPSSALKKSKVMFKTNETNKEDVHDK